MKKLGGSLNTLLTPLSRKRGFFEADLFTQWQTLFPEFAQYARPEKQFKGVLTLAVASDSAKMQLLMNADMLMARINRFYGFQAVHKLVFTTKPFKLEFKEKPQKLVPNPQALAAAEQRVFYVKDEQLKESLRALVALAEMEKQLQQTKQ